ncbi:MAG: AAA family ATPase [bacterium]|nr:AAA family ATPase [bacterium]
MTSIMERLTTTDQVSTMYPRILVVGMAKSGKTSLAKTCPNPLIIDPEAGTIPLRHHKLDRLPVDSWESFIGALQYVRDEEHEWKTLFVDGLSVINGWDIDFIQRQHNVKTMMPELWGVARKHGLKLLGLLKQIQTKRNMMIVVTCTEKMEKDGKTEEVVLRGPDLQGAFRYMICKDFDIVAFTKTQEIPPEKDGEQPRTLYRALTKPHGPRQEAGDRWGVLSTIEELDIGAWMAKIRADSPQSSTTSGPQPGPGSSQAPTEPASGFSPTSSTEPLTPCDAIEVGSPPPSEEPSPGSAPNSTPPSSPKASSGTTGGGDLALAALKATVGELYGTMIQMAPDAVEAIQGKFKSTLELHGISSVKDVEEDGKEALEAALGQLQEWAKGELIDND